MAHCLVIFKRVVDPLNIFMVIIWYNGPSARPFHHIPAQSMEIGCNFIERDRSVHHVCAFDQQTIERMSPRSATQYWTRRRFARDRWQLVDSKLPYYCSGTMAIALAITLTREPIYVLGCDWGITNQSLYDTAYTWRQHQPMKMTQEKLQLMQRFCERHTITFVHTEKRDRFGAVARWIGPREFLSLVQ